MALTDLAGPRDRCGSGCAAFVTKWEAWFDRTFEHDPPACIPVLAEETYLDRIGAKSRNMLVKAARHGYQFRSFDRNDHVDAIYEINRSKPVRSGGPMRQAYLERPALITTPPTLCWRHELVSAGMFHEDRLVAYAHLVFANEIAIVNTILGHADHLPNGVMNALIAAIVDGLERGVSHVRWLNYTTLAGPDGLNRFKRSVGFAETPLVRRTTA